MEYQRVNRSDPERFFMVARNSYSTASFTNGQWAGWDIVTDKDGVNVTKISGAVRAAPMGVAIQTITAGEFGLFQVWGYKRDARCLGGSGSLTTKITAGSPLVFPTSAFAARNRPRTATALKSYWGQARVGIAIEPFNTAAINTQFATSGQYEVLIRCL